MRTFIASLAAAALVAGAAATMEQGAILGDAALRGPLQEWTIAGAAPASRNVRLMIAVKQQHVSELESELMAVSDPNSPRYGQHLSREAIDELVAPPAASTEAVVAWLASHGVSGTAVSTSANGDFVMAHATVAAAETMLDTKYALYAHKDTPEHTVVRLQPGRTYSMPAELEAVVDFVEPTLRFPSLRRMRGGRTAPPTPASAPAAAEGVGNGTLFVSPDFLRKLYKADKVFGTAAGNSQAVAGFIGQFWSKNDLHEFWGLFAPWMKNTTTIKQVGPNNGTAGAEASLDIQYLSSVGAHVPTWVWYTTDQDTPFLTWAVNANAAKTLPKLFSVSYGEYENGDTPAYMNRVGTELQKLGARGVSVLVATGDSGAGGNCTGDHISPDFPASSPWVTGVGGLVGGDTDKTPTGETADYISGGGFSDTFSRPAYQDAAVGAYLKNTTGFGVKPGDYNAKGAGYPDIAAQSEMFTIVVFGIPLPGVAGTSCATPSASGIISLLNDRRLAKGKPALGYLNPFIYQTAGDGAKYPNAFNDALSGANVGCDIYAFPAKKGWDASTGWGSPSYAGLAPAVDALP